MDSRKGGGGRPRKNCEQDHYTVPGSIQRQTKRQTGSSHLALEGTSDNFVDIQREWKEGERALRMLGHCERCQSRIL